MVGNHLHPLAHFVAVRLQFFGIRYDVLITGVEDNPTVLVHQWFQKIESLLILVAQ